MVKYPILYPAIATDFFAMGQGPITTATKAVAIEERNGSFYTELTVLVDDQIFPLIEHNCFIKADAGHILKDQLFRVKRIIPTSDNTASIYAEHVSYLSKDLSLAPEIKSVSLNANNAIALWKANINETNPFTVDSDITTTGTINWRIDKVANPREALGGIEGSLLDIYGGEYRFDNYHISLLKKRGTTANTILAYGRNITDLEQERNITSTYTSVYPFAIYKDNAEQEIVVTLDEKTIHSSNVNSFPNPVIKPVDFSSEFEQGEVPAKTKLKQLAEAYIKANEFGVPTTSIKVSFLDLSKTADYAEYALLEQVDLCDDVKVIYPKLGVNTTAKVVRVVWNILTESYDEIEIGERRASLSTIINDQTNSIKEIEKNTGYAVISADGKNTIFYGLFGPDGLGEPKATKVGDMWFKPDGENTILKIWNGTIWEEILSNAIWKELEKAIEDNKKKVEEAQKAADDAQKTGEDAQTAADDAKKIGQAAQDKANSAGADASQALTNSNDAVNKANEASAKADQSQQTADQAKSDATNAISDANQAKEDAQDALDKAGQADATANQAKTDATTAVNTANEAKSSAGTALDNANQAIADATDALNQSALAKSQAEEAINKYLGMGMSPAWSWSSDGIDRFTPEYPSENLWTRDPELHFNTAGWKQYTCTDDRIKGAGACTVSLKIDTDNTPLSNFRIQLITVNGATRLEVFNKDIPKELINSGQRVYLDFVLTNNSDLATAGQLAFLVGTELAGADVHIYDIKVAKTANHDIYTPASSEDYDNAVPSYIGFAIEPSDNPSDYTWIRNPEKVEGEVKVELTEINGELSRKVSQESFDQLNGTVINQSTLISQNQEAIRAKADKTLVDTINQTVTDNSAAIDLNSKAIELKANQSTVDSLTGKVTTAEGSISTIAGQVALKANKTDVDTIAGRVTSAESQLTVQAGRITGLSTLTDGHTTQIGSLQSGYDGLSSTVSKVESDLNGLEVGGRNYVLESEICPGKLANDVWEDSYRKLSSNITGQSGEFEIGFDLTYPSDATSSASIDITLQTKGTGIATFNVFPYRTISMSPGQTVHLTNKFSFDYSSLTAGGRITAKFGGTPDVLLSLEKLYIKKGNKVTDWSPAPEDQATASEMSSLTQTVNSINATVIANKTDADGKFSSQQTAINANTTAIGLKASQTSVNALTGRVSTAEGSIDVLSGQVALKASQSVVDTLTNTVNAQASELTVQAGKISGLTTTTNGHTTKIGALELQAGQFDLSLSNVQNDLNGLEIGGRNYVLESEICPGKLANAVWEDSYRKLSSNITGQSGEFEIGFDLTYPSDATSSASIDITLQTKGTGIATFNVFPYRTISMSPGQTVHLTNKFNFDYSSLTVGGRITAKFGGAPDVLLSLEKLYIKKGNKVTDWSPAPEDMATVTDVTSIQATVNSLTTTVSNKADKTQVTQLANQWQQTTDLANGHTSQISSLGDAINFRITNTDGSITQIDLANKVITLSGEQVNITGNTYIANGVIKTANIADLAVNTAKIANLAVSEAKIGNLAVSSAKIADAAITSAKIGLAAIGTAHIGDGVITTAKIGSLSADKITVGTLNGENVNIINLNANNIVSGRLDANLVNVTNLNATNITTGTLNAARIGAGEITADKIASNAITADKISAGAITASKIASKAITADNLNVTELSALSSDLGTVTAATIKNDFFELQAYAGVQPRIILNSIDSLQVSKYGTKITPYDVSFFSESSTGTQGIRKASGGLIVYNSDKDGGTGILLSVASATTITVKRLETVITGSLNVTASKNAIHPTRDGVRATPAYELAESYLGDIGRSYTDETCTSIVPIEILFSDTVNLDVPYEVFLQAYDDAHFWISDFTSTHFVVQSDKPMMRFAWELKAKRRGFENERLVLNNDFNNDLIEQTWREAV